MMQTNPGKSPTHRAYAVTQGKSKKSFWREIGAAWAHEDGKGFSLKLDFLPLGSADIVIREPLPKESETDEAVETEA